MTTPSTMIVTAADQQRFADATIYDVTYIGERGQDSNVRWGYIRRAVTAGSARPEIICRNRDGTDAGRRIVE